MIRCFAILILLSTSSCTGPSFFNPSSLVSRSSGIPKEANVLEKKRVDRICPSKFEIDPTKPLELIDLVDIALMHNPDLKVSWEDAKIAAYQYASTESAYFPSFQFNGSWTKLSDVSVYDGQAFTSKYYVYGPSVAFDYLIFDCGVRKNEVEAAYQYVQYQNWQQAQQIQATLKEVTLDYYMVLAEKALVQARFEDLADAKETLKAAKEKMLFGIIDESELMQATTSYYQKKLNLTEEENAFEKAVINLLRSVGIAEKAAVKTIAFPMIDLKRFEFSEEILLSQAEKLRPDLLASKANMLRSKANLSKTEAEILPQINLTGNGGQDWFTGGLTDNGDYTITFNLSFPLFQGFYYKNQIVKAKKEVTRAQTEVDRSWNDIVAEVRTAYTNFVTSKEDYKSSMKYLDAAQKQFDSILARYKQGVNTIIDVFNAEAFLSDARAKFIQSQKDFFASLIQIAFATGSMSNPQLEEKK